MADAIFGVLFRAMIDDIGRDLLNLFSGLFIAPLPVLSVPLFNSLQQIASGLALGALCAFISWQAVRRMIQSMDGSSDIAPEVLIRRGLVAGVTVTSISLLGWGAGTIADLLRRILVGFGIDFSFLTFVLQTNAPLTFLFLGVVFLGGTMVLLLQRAQLYMEFAMLIILGPLVAVSLAADDNPLPWAMWKRELVAVCVTPVLQLMLFILFARLMVGPDGDTIGVGKWVGAFSLLVLLWKMPTWARQFTMTTGTGHGIAQVGASATRMAVLTYIARVAITKGA